ncbi:MAG: hypothetical protein AABZ41_02580 [Bacteroidota bacterium]
MKHSASKFIAVVILMLCASIAAIGQTPITSVQFELPAFNYDVLYLADFIDVGTQKLASNIPDFSGSIIPLPSGSQGQIYITAKASIQLQGDPAPIELIRVATRLFRLGPGARTFSARDLAKGSTSDIQVDDPQTVEDRSQRDRLEKYGERFPTAPVGQYVLDIEARSGTTVLGRIRKTIRIRNASPDEVVVTLLDPQPGAVISSIAPTFSWSSPNPKIKLSVYEKLPVHQTPQEATTGIPYLAVELNGLSTLTYPANAPRRLEQNRTYVWFVETEVTTNRGPVRRRSELNVFRIQLSNPQQQAVEQLFNGLGSSAQGTYATLQGIGWLPSGEISLDGKRLTRDELAGLITKTAGQSIQFKVRVENVAR